MPLIQPRGGNFLDKMTQEDASLEDKMTSKMKQMMNEMKALVVTTPAPIKAVEEAPTPQIQGVSKTDFENYVKANDAVLKNVQNQGQNLENQMANVTSLLTSLCDNFKIFTSTSNSGTLPSSNLPEKLERSRNSYPCALKELNRTSALADSGASINLFLMLLYMILGTLKLMTLLEMTSSLLIVHTHPMGNSRGLVVKNVEIKNSNVFDEPVLLNTPLSDKVAQEDNNDEINAFLAMEVSTNFEEGYFDSEGELSSLSVSPIPVEDSEPTQEEIDIFLVPDDLLPPGVENDDSEEEVNELPNFDHQDDPSIPRPPPKPPDVEKCFEPEAGILIIKEFKGVSKSHDFMTGILPTLPTLVSDLTFISSFFSFESEDTIFDPGIVTFLEPVAFSMAVSCSKYGYIKNHKKTIKNKQAQTQERKSAQKPEAKPRKSQSSVNNGGDTGSDGDGIGGSGGEGIWGSGEDHGESGDDGGVDIARSLATSASDHTGVGTRAGIEILAVTRYACCGGGVAADLIQYRNVLISSADGPDP
ncbi:hypothetical protein Tco_0015947 [Tanacetum coccineum]